MPRKALKDHQRQKGELPMFRAAKIGLERDRILETRKRTRERPLF